MGKQAAPRRVGDKEALAVGTTIRHAVCHCVAPHPSDPSRSAEGTLESASSASV